MYLSQQVVLLRRELFIAEHARHQGCELKKIEGVRLVRIELSHEGVELRVRDLIPEESANQSSSEVISGHQRSSRIAYLRRSPIRAHQRLSEAIGAQSERNLASQLLDGNQNAISHPNSSIASLSSLVLSMPERGGGSISTSVPVPPPSVPPPSAFPPPLP